MLPWMTLRLGWGCISSGEGPSSGLHGNLKKDTVIDTGKQLAFYTRTIVAK